MTNFTIEKPRPRAPIITIFGDAGTGKNSLASAIARKPIVIRAEDGVHRQSRSLETPDAFPTCQSADDVFAQLMWLLREDHPYTDLIFDSASAADALFCADVIKNGGKNGNPASSMAVAYGGYGAGYSAVAASHGRVRKAAGLLNERKGMAIIFLVHADLETMKLPDMDDYQRWGLKLTTAKNANSAAHYVDNADIVAHVRLASALRGDDDDRKKVISNGDREIVVHATAASVTKNGLGITEPLDFEEGTNPLAPYMGQAVEGDGEAEDEKPSRRRRKPEMDPVATVEEEIEVAEEEGEVE